MPPKKRPKVKVESLKVKGDDFDVEVPGPGPLESWARERFCLEYVADPNATRAADRAGYSRRTARAIGSRLLTQDDIRARINQLRLERSVRLKIDADRVLEEYAVMAFSTMADFVDISGGNDDPELEKAEQADEATGQWPFRKVRDISPMALRAVAEFSDRSTEHGSTRSLKLYSKKDALDKIGEHIRFFPPKQTHITGKNGQPLVPAAAMTDEHRTRAILDILTAALDRKRSRREDGE